MATKGNLNSAAIDALVLALIVIFCGLISSLASFLGWIMWIVQLVATVWMLVRFMKRFSKKNAAENGSTTYGQAFTYGFLVSLCSAVVIAVYAYFDVKFINAETISTAMEAARQQMAGMGQEEILDKVLDNLPFITLVGRLVWCTILGVVFSAIIANSCKIEGAAESTEDIIK